MTDDPARSLTVRRFTGVQFVLRDPIALILALARSQDHGKRKRIGPIRHHTHAVHSFINPNEMHAHFRSLDPSTARPFVPLRNTPEARRRPGTSPGEREYRDVGAIIVMGYVK